MFGSDQKPRNIELGEQLALADFYSSDDDIDRPLSSAFLLFESEEKAEFIVKNFFKAQKTIERMLTAIKVVDECVILVGSDSDILCVNKEFMRLVDRATAAHDCREGDLSLMTFESDWLTRIEKPFGFLSWDDADGDFSVESSTEIRQSLKEDCLARRNEEVGQKIHLEQVEGYSFEEWRREVKSSFCSRVFDEVSDVDAFLDAIGSQARTMISFFPQMEPVSGGCEHVMERFASLAGIQAECYLGNLKKELRLAKELKEKEFYRVVLKDRVDADELIETLVGCVLDELSSKSIPLNVMPHIAGSISDLKIKSSFSCLFDGNVRPDVFCDPGELDVFDVKEMLSAVARYLVRDAFSCLGVHYSRQVIERLKVISASQESMRLIEPSNFWGTLMLDSMNGTQEAWFNGV